MKGFGAFGGLMACTRSEKVLLMQRCIIQQPPWMPGRQMRTSPHNLPSYGISLSCYVGNIIIIWLDCSWYSWNGWTFLKPKSHFKMIEVSLHMTQSFISHLNHYVFSATRCFFLVSCLMIHRCFCPLNPKGLPFVFQRRGSRFGRRDVARAALPWTSALGAGPAEAAKQLVEWRSRQRSAGKTCIGNIT